MQKDNPDLSVIIPCYNEELILEDNFNNIKDILDRAAFEYEIIFVDDGSKDKTVEIAKKIAQKDKKTKLICHDKNIGRGKAVEDGIWASRGKIVGFLDIDLQVPARYIIPLVIEIEKGTDVATAFRVYDIRLHMIHRFILSKGYNRLLRFMLNTSIKDSETGFKFFSREKALPLLQEIKEKHWFWDTEVMVRAELRGYKIKEIPCLCIREEAQKSTVRIFKDVRYYLINLFRFKKEMERIRAKKRKNG